MLNYDLLKSLKDTGFPFDFDRKCPQCTEEGTHSNCPDSTPTLSELIEACGDEMNTLIKSDGKWSAYDNSFIGNSPAGVGLTPEEAVASLFIALHKKDA